MVKTISIFSEDWLCAAKMVHQFTILWEPQGWESFMCPCAVCKSFILARLASWTVVHLGVITSKLGLGWTNSKVKPLLFILAPLWNSFIQNNATKGFFWCLWTWTPKSWYDTNLSAVPRVPQRRWDANVHLLQCISSITRHEELWRAGETRSREHLGRELAHAWNGGEPGNGGLPKLMI
jgi:hypothetical protein